MRASRAVLRRVLADRAAVLTANAQEELSSESILGGQILSMLAVPLWRGDDIIGLIQADNRATAGMFAEPDLEVALLLAAQASLAIDNATLVQRLRVAEEQRARRERLPASARSRQIKFDNIIGDSPAMKAVFAQLEKVIDTRATVCIEGETGTGKELIASAIHYQSQRRDKMFVAQNCAALPENLLESELFGHKRGAFTGADSDKKGLFEIADGGTLFLDEMGEMPLTLQAKLLRVLQEGTIRPVGATSEKQVDVRIICATNRDLAAEVEKGRFRQDLYYRLMVFPIELPPLRERREDIPLLAAHFLKRYAERVPRRAAGLHAGRARRAGVVQLAGQHPRAGERDPAPGDPGRARPLDRDHRSVAAAAQDRGHVTRDRAAEGHAQGDDGAGRALADHRGAARARRQQDQDRRHPRDHARGAAQEARQVRRVASGSCAAPACTGRAARPCADGGAARLLQCRHVAHALRR